MAVLVESEIAQLVREDLELTDTTNPVLPLSTGSELENAINDALAQVFEISGGRILKVASATAWTPSPTADTSGTLTSIPTDIGDIIHLFYSTSAPSVGIAGDAELDRVEMAELKARRARGSLLGTYTTPKIYAWERLSTVTEADQNKITLEVFPGISGANFPIHYVPQFSPLNNGTRVTPPVNDLESRDVGHIAALALAPRYGRTELMNQIAARISERTQLELARRAGAMGDARQNVR